MCFVVSNFVKMMLFASIFALLVLSVNGFDSNQFLQNYCKGAETLSCSNVSLTQKDSDDIQQNNFIISNATSVRIQGCQLLVNGAFFEKFPRATELFFENCELDMMTDVKRPVSPHAYMRSLIIKSSSVMNGEGIKTLTNLTSMQFDKSTLSRCLPQNFLQQLPQLNTFTLRECGYCLISNYAFKGLSNLKNVEISGNELYAYELAFQGAENLERLQLDYNRIGHIKTAWFPSSLKILHLRNNFLRFLTKNMFNKLISLRELYLSGNQIEQISGEAFTNLRDLGILHLQNNQIRNFTADHLKGNEKVHYLDISNNNITQLCDIVFDGLINLEFLKY